MRACRQNPSAAARELRLPGPLPKTSSRGKEGERDARAELDAIELIGAEDHAILHAHGAGLTAVDDLPLPDGIYNLFTIEDGKVTRIDDFAEHGKALIAAGLAAG